MLLKLVLPSLSGQEVHDVTMQRVGKPQAKPWCSTTDAGAEVMDESDFKEVKSAAAAALDSESTVRQVGDLLKSGSKYIEVVVASVVRKDPEIVGKAGVRRFVDMSKVTTVTAVQKYLPRVKGCTVQWVKPKNSWIVYYPEAKPMVHTQELMGRKQHNTW